MSKNIRNDCLVSDPIISTDLVAFSPSRSRVGSSRPPIATGLITQSEAFAVGGAGEREPLLGASILPPKKPFYRPRPLWLVPFAITAALVRGMTLAPRVEVFTQLSCNALRYNHTSSTISLPVHTASKSYSHYTPIYFSLDPSGPPLSPSHFKSSHDSNITFPITIHSDDDEEDPRRIPSPQCISDPVVQAGVARIQTTMTIISGALSALTTGWWGHFGERHGRTKVLAIATLGLFLTDLTFILVSTPHTPFSTHGHKFLVLAPLMEGLLGGWSTLQGATSAYVSDCTSAGSRAHIFSRFTGVFYIGFALGPAVGAALIQHSGARSGGERGAETVTAVFWVAVCCSFMNLMLLLFVFPESLPAEKQLKARSERLGNGKGKARSSISSAQDEDADDNNNHEGPEHKPGILMAFLRPLAIFLPTPVQFQVPGKGVQTKKDWSLTWLALSLFGYMLSTGLFQIKYLYAEHVYEWGAQQLSYYISFLGGVRAFHLLFILPFIIATFKPKPKPKPKLTAFTPTTSTDPNTKPTKPKPTRAHLAREIKFDLSLTRFSLVVDILSQTFVVLSPVPSHKMHTSDGGADSAATTDFSMAQSQTLFVLSSTLSSFGSGLVPAIHSLALCILQARALSRADVSSNGADGQTQEGEADIGVGKLFGALAVLQAVGQMILGPMLFGLIYSGTVATLPKAIFMTTAGLLLCSLTLMFLVRPDLGERRAGNGGVSASGNGKIGKKTKRARQEGERGRSRVSKDLRKGVWATGSESRENEASGST